MTSHGIIATDNLPTAGAIVYWRLEGALDVERLRAAWEAAGLPAELLPDTPPTTTALARAVRERQGGRVLVRPLEGKGGYAVVHERARGDDLSHSVQLSVKLDPTGRLLFQQPGGGWVRAAALPNTGAAEIAGAYERHLMECAAEDVGTWLVRLVTKFVDGVGLRDTGGIYYVPPAHVAVWDLIAGCVREVSAHRTFRIPAVRSSEAVQAVLDAVEQEARREFDGMMEEAKGALGERAINARYDRVEDVERKVARYEEMLGQRLDSFRERAEELRAALAVAMLKAEAAAERAAET